MRELYYRVYLELSDWDSISIDELIDGTKGVYKSVEEAKVEIINNCDLIKEIKLENENDNVVVKRVSIVEILVSERDIETDIVITYNANELKNIK